MKGEMLPSELLWDGPHVSELGLTAIADGQEAIVTREALAHAEACEHCAGRLGHAALLSAAVGGAVAEVLPARRVATLAARRAAPPWRALALGLAVAVLAALPSLPHLAHAVGLGLWFGKALAARGVPVLVRGGVALASDEAARRALTLATLAASALLVLMGAAIARARSHGTSERSVS